MIPLPSRTRDSLWLVRGHDNQAGGLPREEHSNGQSSVVGSMRQTLSSQASRLRTHNVVRRIDTWSVLKVSAVFYIAVYCILLVASSLLWFAATQTGLRENVEKVIADLIASGKFHFVGGELLRAGAIGGAMLVVLGTAGNVMLSVLYNLISDLVGGVSIVVEERSVRVGRVPADDPVKQLPAVEPHRTTTELAPPEPVKILVPQVEQRPEPQQPTQPQAPQPASGPEAQPSQPKPQAQPETQTSRLPQPQPQQPQQPQNPQPPQPQAQPPQPEPRPQPEPSQPRLPLPIPAPSPEMPDEQLLGAERAADGNLEAFGL